MLLPEGAPIAPDGYDVGKHPGLRGWYSIHRPLPMGFLPNTYPCKLRGSPCPRSSHSLPTVALLSNISPSVNGTLRMSPLLSALAPMPLRSMGTLSRASQGASISVRPKWPNAAVG